jgi:hypothetical protein
VAVLLLLLAIFLRLSVLPRCIIIPLLELARVFSVGFKIGDCSAVGT